MCMLDETAAPIGFLSSSPTAVRLSFPTPSPSASLPSVHPSPLLRRHERIPRSARRPRTLHHQRCGYVDTHTHTHTTTVTAVVIRAPRCASVDASVSSRTAQRSAAAMHHHTTTQRTPHHTTHMRLTSGREERGGDEWFERDAHARRAAAAMTAVGLRHAPCPCPPSSCRAHRRPRRRRPTHATTINQWTHRWITLHCERTGPATIRIDSNRIERGR